MNSPGPFRGSREALASSGASTAKLNLIVALHQKTKTSYALSSSAAIEEIFGGNLSQVRQMFGNFTEQQLTVVAQFVQDAWDHLGASAYCDTKATPLQLAAAASALSMAMLVSPQLTAGALKVAERGPLGSKLEAYELALRTYQTDSQSKVSRHDSVS